MKQVPEYFIKIKNFKKLSPKIARLEFEDDEPFMIHISSIKLNGVKCYSFDFDKVECVIVEINKKYYMLEMSLVKELKLNMGDICGV